MKNRNQIIWSEIRDEDGDREMFYLLAEKVANGWAFFERSSWELRWYPITPTEHLVKKATTEGEHPTRTLPGILHLRHVA